MAASSSGGSAQATATLQDFLRIMDVPVRMQDSMHMAAKCSHVCACTSHVHVQYPHAGTKISRRNWLFRLDCITLIRSSQDIPLPNDHPNLWPNLTPVPKAPDTMTTRSADLQLRPHTLPRPACIPCIDIATDHDKEIRSSVALIGSARVYLAASAIDTLSSPCSSIEWAQAKLEVQVMLLSLCSL